MKALTVKQPWAGLIATGVKRIENRSWRPPANMLGDRFAIHAGKSIDLFTVKDLLEAGELENQSWYARGAVVATARLVTWITHPHQIDEYTSPEQRRWFFGPIGFVLADVRPLVTPVRCKGLLGFWSLPAEIAAEVGP